jgi:hypothetical protein
MSTPYYAIPSHPLADDEPGLVAAVGYLREYFTSVISDLNRGPLAVGMMRAADEARRKAAQSQRHHPTRHHLRRGDSVFCRSTEASLWTLGTVVDVGGVELLLSDGRIYHVSELRPATVEVAENIRIGIKPPLEPRLISS